MLKYKIWRSCPSCVCCGIHEIHFFLLLWNSRRGACECNVWIAGCHGGIVRIVCLHVAGLLVLVVVRDFTHKLRGVVLSHKLGICEPTAAGRIVGIDPDGIPVLPCVIDGACEATAWSNGGVDAQVRSPGTVGYGHRTAATGQVNLIREVLSQDVRSMAPSPNIRNKFFFMLLLFNCCTLMMIRVILDV